MLVAKYEEWKKGKPNMKTIAILIVVCFISISCGPSEDDLLKTAVPVTQTADALMEEKANKEFVNCLSEFQGQASQLFDVGSSCSFDDLECKHNTADKMETLAIDFARNCQIKNSCLSQIRYSAIRLVNTEAAYVHGSNPNDTEYGQMMATDILGQDLMDANRSLADAYASCDAYPDSLGQ